MQAKKSPYLAKIVTINYESLKYYSNSEEDGPAIYSFFDVSLKSGENHESCKTYLFGETDILKINWRNFCNAYKRF